MGAQDRTTDRIKENSMHNLEETLISHVTLLVNIKTVIFSFLAQNAIMFFEIMINQNYYKRYLYRFGPRSIATKMGAARYSGSSSRIISTKWNPLHSKCSSGRRWKIFMPDAWSDRKNGFRIVRTTYSCRWALNFVPVQIQRIFREFIFIKKSDQFHILYF